MMTYAVFFAVGVAVVLAIAMMIMGGNGSKARRKQMYEKLNECLDMARGDRAAKTQAIIRLDTLLGDSLSYAGVSGESVGEKLKNAKKLYERKKYDQIWSAHKLRNRLVHEHYDITDKEAEIAVATLNSAIRRLLK